MVKMLHIHAWGEGVQAVSRGRGVLKTKFKTKNILNVIITKVDYFKHIKAD